MKIEMKKPVISMTEKEFKTICNFLSMLYNENCFEPYTIEELVEDFPCCLLSVTDPGDIYDINIED